MVGMNRALGESECVDLYTLTFSPSYRQIRMLLHKICLPQRTGVSSNKPNAHKLIPRFATEWGASAMTVSQSVAFA